VAPRGNERQSGLKVSTGRMSNRFSLHADSNKVCAAMSENRKRRSTASANRSMMFARSASPIICTIFEIEKQIQSENAGSACSWIEINLQDFDPHGCKLTQKCRKHSIELP
jgi:hypothetical protein